MHFLLLIETKARNELGADDVKAKAQGNGAKPWRYLLVPHDKVTEDQRLVDHLAFESVAS